MINLNQHLDIETLIQNNQIHICQIGYPCKGKKIAYIANYEGSCALLHAEAGRVTLVKESAYSVNNTQEKDKASGDRLTYFDFSEIEEPGVYVVYVEGLGISYEFTIGNHVYIETKDALLKGLYYQRCGIELHKDYARAWEHPICHNQLARLYNDETVLLDVSGGWHDAGDYGRYVTPAAVTLADMLLSYELCEEVYQEPIGIPESSNGIPDILNEAKYELTWLLKMQSKQTKGVYHKVTSKEFCGMVMPHEDEEPMVILEESLVAIADFAGIMAMAARVYEPFDKEFSKNMLEAARNAWEWVEHNLEKEGFHNPKGVNTGEYGDNNSKDEILFAAVSLYVTTEEEKFHTIVKKYLDLVEDKVSLGWGNVGGYATLLYLLNGKAKDVRVENVFLEVFERELDKRLKIAKEDGYSVSILPQEYGWGSNMRVLNHGMFACFGHLFTGKDEYLHMAKQQLEYILGVNPLNISYITGIGANFVNEIHHRPSAADHVELAVPGLISGGPNYRLSDDILVNNIPTGTPSSRCFLDHEGSYSSNEITIYWNSPGIFIAAYLEKYYMS